MKRMIVTGLVCLLGASLYAQDLEKETTISLGLNATDGNSETMQFNFGVESKCNWPETGTLDSSFVYNYGKQKVDDINETNVDNAKILANGRRLFSERSFGYLEGSLRYDDIALIDYRGTLGPGIGTRIVNTEAAVVLIEAGASYIAEKVDDVRDDYAAYRIAEEYTHSFGEKSRIWQTLEYLPRIEEVEMFLLNTELGIESAINSHMSLRVVLTHRYDSDPPVDIDKGDLSIVAGLGIRL